MRLPSSPENDVPWFFEELEPLENELPRVSADDQPRVSVELWLVVCPWVSLWLKPWLSPSLRERVCPLFSLIWVEWPCVKVSEMDSPMVLERPLVVVLP